MLYKQNYVCLRVCEKDSAIRMRLRVREGTSGGLAMAGFQYVFNINMCSIITTSSIYYGANT